jgi:SNF2 family DNA or RNA helicase
LIVLHACWSHPTLRVWGESSYRRPGVRRRAAIHPAAKAWPHPFAAEWGPLHDAVEGVGLAQWKDASRFDLTLRLPSYPRSPQPSPQAHRFESAETGEEVEGTALWTVPAVYLSGKTAAALDFLLALPAAPPQGVLIGDSLRGLAEAAKLALELVARGRVVPVLDGASARGGEAVWRPVLTDPADQAHFEALVRSLPGACWAAEPAHEDDGAAGFIRALVDGCVRQGLGGHKLAPTRRGRRPAAEVWLRALAERSGTFTAEGGAAEPLQAALAAWSRPVAPASRGGVRTCFLLTPPDPAVLAAAEAEALARGLVEGEATADALAASAGAGAAPEAPWRLEFLLQSVDDPSLLVAAGEVWRTRGPLPILRGSVADPQERLIGDLGRALRLFPPLEPALRTARPTGVDLDAEAAYRFLREGAPLLAQAGFAVRVPAWWTRPATRLGVKLRARPATAAAAEGSSGRFGMETIVAYDWQLSLGGVALSAEEFRALAGRKVPLVRFRGEWVELKPAEVEAALRLFDRHGSGEMTAAEVLRLAAGVDSGTAGLPLAGVEAEGWLGELLDGAGDATVKPAPEPPGFVGKLRPYQKRGVGWLSFLDRLGVGACLADDMGLGKAQPLDAKILTPDGWKLMGDIRAGDEVIGASGEPCRVRGVYPRGEREVFRVTFSDGSATECCDDHLWQVHSPVQKRRGTPPRVLPLKEIRTRLRDGAGNSRYYIPMVAPVQFHEQPLPLDPYLLGALLADGGIAHHVVFSTAEIEMVERVTAGLPPGTSIRHKRGVDYSIRGPARGVHNPLLDALRELGLAGCRSETKHIPDIYKFASVDSRTALLQGLLDTDGHVRPGDNNVEYCTVSRRLAEDTQFLVQSLGGRARIRTKPTKRQLAYRMSICLPNSVKPFALGRKAATYRGREKYPPSRAIVDVQPVGIRPVQCIAVDAPDHLYVTDDFIVTHNTVELLALLLSERKDKGRTPPTLLVCPMSLVGNWQREAARFAPGLRVHVHHGAERLGGAALRKAIRGSDLVLTTYALAARDREELASVEWGRVVLDEAQNVKNAATRQSQAVRAFRAPRRIALTGTPVENRLGELWSILDFLNPGLLGPAATFRRRFATPIERYRDTERADELKRLVRPFILRRLKTDRRIIRDLPAKHEMRVFCNLTREQASLYQATVDEMIAKVEASTGIERRGLVLATLLRLKQVCNHPAQLLQDGSALPGRSGKVARLEEILEEVLELGDRALVFTQFAEMGHMLRSHLEERFGHEVPFLHGGTSRAARDGIVASFQAEGGPPILLLSLKAGGTGLNLTAANHVIHFDRWWNPAVEDQATDRAFRIGQRRDVQVRKLVCAGTLEERIDEMIEEKKQLAESVLGAGEAWLTELSTAQLRQVVALAADAVAE